MKTDLTTPGSYAQAKTLAAPKGDPALKKAALKAGDLKDVKPSSGPDYKLDLSGSKSSLPQLPSLPSTPSAPSSTSAPESVPRSKIDPDLVKDMEAKIVKESAKEEIKEKAKAEALEEVLVKEGTLKRPAIIFIKGWDVFSSPSKSESGYAGMARIAESVDGSKVFGWSQKDEIIKEIKKVQPNQPVVLVGHSFGGDTAVEVANELDSLENNFRGVDLLVTIDAIGYNNDIVPQNVRKHLNVFGEKSFLLNDGPHVARDHDKTDVKNILSPLDHTDIDDDKSVQYEIVNLIQKSLTGFI
jgi:hypothetical protein